MESYILKQSKEAYRLQEEINSTILRKACELGLGTFQIFDSFEFTGPKNKIEEM